MIKLKQAFVKALILNHIDLERYIQIETDVLGYAIGRIFTQLTSDNLGQWHLVVFFSIKIIPVKTCYKIYNNELLASIKVFKT